MSIEELQAENAALKAKNAELESVIMGLRFVSNNPDIEDAYTRRHAIITDPSPPVGTRVRIAHTGCKYAHKDFASVFADVKVEFTETVEPRATGFVLAKAPHFKKTDVEVFLIKLDNNKGAVFARKGLEPLFWEGAYVNITNTGCKYSAQDFKAQFPNRNLSDQCRNGDRGVIVETRTHYKNPKVLVHVVALDAQMRCVVMSGKGLVLREIPALTALVAKREREAKQAEEAAKKEKERAAAAAAAAAAADANPSSPAKRTADEAGMEEPDAKKAKEEEQA